MIAIMAGGSVLLALFAAVAIRASLLGGLRGFFAVGTGGGYLAVWLAIFAWQRDMTPILWSSMGFVVVGWLLVVGGRFHLALKYDREYKTYTRQTTILRCLTGYSPRLRPAFSIDGQWLLGGIGSAGAGLFLAIAAPSQFLLAWGATLIGALGIVASAGGVISQRSG